MQALEFINQLPQLKTENCFFLYGEEQYLVDHCKDALIAALDIQFPEMNLTILKEKTTYADVKNACLQAPCFAELRVVLLEDIDISEKALQFEKVMEVLPPQTKLILAYSKKPDMRKGIYKDMKKNAVSAEGDALKGDGLLKWLVGNARKSGITLTKGTAELLIEIAGSEMYALKNEVDKLKYAGITKPNAEQLHTVAAGSTEYDIFQFHNHMMAGEYEEAFGIFEKVKRDRSGLIGFIGLLVSKFSPMYMAKQCAIAGMNDRQIADRLSETTGMKTYPALFAARDCRSFSLAQIRTALQQLEQVDQQLKMGGKLQEYKLTFLKMYGKL